MSKRDRIKRARKGGEARAASLTPERRREIASLAAKARHSQGISTGCLTQILGDEESRVTVEQAEKQAEILSLSVGGPVREKRAEAG